MRLFNMATVVIVISLVSVEFSVAVFIDPAARRLDPEPQLKLLSRLASVLGKVMPGLVSRECSIACSPQTWLSWHSSGAGFCLQLLRFGSLLRWESILFLVPLNTRVAEGDADWQRIHRIWDKRHRVRTAALAVAPSCSHM